MTVFTVWPPVNKSARVHFFSPEEAETFNLGTQSCLIWREEDVIIQGIKLILNNLFL